MQRRKTIETLGIIGFGSFGALLARLLAPYVAVLVADQQPLTAALPANVRLATLAEVAQCQVIVIATDLTGIAPVCDQLAPLVNPQTIVMDICSVKVMPAHILMDKLGNRCRLLATHPLFGPNSVAKNGDSCKGLVMVWHELAGGACPEVEALFAERLGVTIRHMTPEEHDRQMAWVHALTFFVGRGLVLMDIPEPELATDYYDKLRDLCALERTHSQALFDTIEAGNPYAAAIRQRFITTLQQLDADVQRIDPWQPH